MPNHSRILYGLLLGAIAGVITNLATDGGESTRRFVSLVTEPVGRMWLSSLIMVVIPLVLSSLSLGVAGLGDLKKVGRIGLATFLIFIGLTTVSAVISLCMNNLIQPGSGLDPALRSELMATYADDARNAAGMTSRFSIDVLVNIIPRNPIKSMAEGDLLAVVFFAIILGVALVSIPRERAAPMISVLDSLCHVTVAIIHLVMKLAPLGVFCLIFSVTARFGYDLLLTLSSYILTVIGGLAIMGTVVYALILKFGARRNPIDFMRRSRVVAVTAFSTSSSNATLPTVIDVAQTELGIRKEVAGFVLPLGATMNQNGTSLFEGATVLFLAQVFGLDLTLGQQIIVIVMSVVTAIGVAGVPGGSIPFIMVVLGMVGVPMEGIAIILGVDRILDMCRTVVNVIGDLVAAAVIQRIEERPRASA